MGYEVHFKPSKEKMETYKSWHHDKQNDDYPLIDEIKHEILVGCMNKTLKRKDMFFKLKLLDNYLTMDTKDEAYDRWKNEEDGILWYCGWEFSRPANSTKKDILKFTLDNLMILMDIVSTPDYYDEQEKFYEKIKTIKDEIDGFIECMEDLTIHEIIEDLDEFKVNYSDVLEERKKNKKRQNDDDDDDGEEEKETNWKDSVVYIDEKDMQIPEQNESDFPSMPPPIIT